MTNKIYKQKCFSVITGELPKRGGGLGQFAALRGRLGKKEWG